MFRGNIYTTGSYYGVCDFDPGTGTFNLTSAGSLDIYISKLDSNGNYIWAGSIGGTDPEQGVSIATDLSGNVYVTGYFSLTIDADPGSGTALLTSAGNDDILLSKLDPNGSLIWAHRLGGTGQDVGHTVISDQFTNIYTAGSFRNTVDFDPGQGSVYYTSSGNSDVFSLKLKQCTDSYDSISHTSCADYTSPSGKYTWNISGTYLDTIMNLGGCDSIITIDLTIIVVDTSVTVNSPLLTANATAATFQWLDCSNGYNAINGATSATYLVTANGSYAVEVMQNGCKDTSVCIMMIITGEQDIGSGYDMVAYPNPTNGNITFDLGAALNNVVIVFTDVMGREIGKETFASASKLDMFIPGDSGVYFVIISVEGHLKAFMKVLKE